MANKNTGNQILKGTVWSLIDNFVRQAITFAVFIVLARILNPEVFGLLSVALLIVQVFRSVIFDGIATAIVRKVNPTATDYNTGFWMCICLSVPAFLLLFFLADQFEIWMGTRGLAAVMKATSLMILTGGLVRMHEAWLTHSMNFKSLAIRSCISVALGGACGIYMAKKGYGVQSVVVQQLVSAFTELLLLWFITPWRPGMKVSRESLLEITKFSKHVALTGLTNFANQNSDTFFVTYYLGAAATGIYTTGKRISNTLNMVISSALLRVSLPAFARLQHDDAGLSKAYLNSTSLTAMVTAPLFFGLAFLSKDITLLMLGEKWLSSVPVMQIVTLVGFLTSIGYYNQSIMLAKNKPQWQTRLTFLYAFTNIAAFIAFTRFGLVYTALAFAIRALVLYPVSVWCALKLTGVAAKHYISAILPALSSAAMMLLVLWSISGIMATLPVTARVLLSLLCGALSYCIFIYFLMSPVYRVKTQRFFNRKFSKI